MTDVLFIAAIFACELIGYALIGSLLPMSRTHSFCENVCGGCMLYMALLWAAALAATLFECPLSVFSRIWAVCVGALAGAAVVRGAGSALDALSVRLRAGRRSAEGEKTDKESSAEPETSNGNAGTLPIVMTVLAFVCIFAFTFLSMILPAVRDTSGVIGQMTQDLYHDSISLYVPGSDARITSMEPRTLLARYYVHDLFICELTGLHPMAEMRLIRTGLMTLISCMAVWRIFVRLFEGNRSKAGAGMLLYLVVSLFFQRPYTPSGMLFSTGWTGNAAFAAVVLPVLLLLILHLYEEPERFNLLLLMVMTGIAAVSCSAQAILVYPFAALSLGIPLIIRTKDWLYLFRVILWLIIPVAALCVCLLVPEIGV